MFCYVTFVGSHGEGEE